MREAGWEPTACGTSRCDIAFHSGSDILPPGRCGRHLILVGQLGAGGLGPLLHTWYVCIYPCGDAYALAAMLAVQLSLCADTLFLCVWCCA